MCFQTGTYAPAGIRPFHWLVFFHVQSWELIANWVQDCRDIHQNKREALLKKFHDGEYSILVATDVASRGLHIPDVTHIFNYDLPELGEDYVHRIGRTARAGKSGAAISFACEDLAMNLIDIESYTRSTIPTMSISNDLLIKPRPPVKMKGDRLKPSGGKPQRPRHKNGPPRHHHQRRK